MSDEKTTISVHKQTTHKYLRRIKLAQSSVHSEPTMDDVILSLIPDQYKDSDQ